MLGRKNIEPNKKIRHIYRAPIDNSERFNNDDEIKSRIENKVDMLGEKIDVLGENLGKKIDMLGENLGEKIDGGFLNLQKFFVELFAEYFGPRKANIIGNDDIGEKGQENYSANYEGKKAGLEQISLSSDSHKNEQQKGKVFKKAEMDPPKASRGKITSMHDDKIEMSGHYYGKNDTISIRQKYILQRKINKNN